MLLPWFNEPNTMHMFRTAPTGRKSSSHMLTQGFTLGYFRLLPPGGTTLLVSHSFIRKYNKQVLRLCCAQDNEKDKARNWYNNKRLEAFNSPRAGAGWP
jgi:hypothetical protein